MYQLPMIVIEELNSDILKRFSPAGLTELLTDIHTYNPEEPDAAKESLQLLIQETLTVDFGYTSSLHHPNLAEIKKTCAKRIRNTKRNWLKSFTEEWGEPRHPLTREIEAVRTLQLADSSLLQSQMKVNLKEYEEEQLRVVKGWAKSFDTLLSDYPYFATLSTIQRKSAIQNDLLYYVATEITQKYGVSGNIEKAIDRSPELITTPVFAKKNEKLEVHLAEEEDQFDGFDTYVNVYEGADERLLRTIIQVKNSEVLVPTRNIQALDQNDRKLISYVLSNAEGNFFKDRTISVNIHELIHLVYKSRGGKNIRMIEEKLTRITNFQFELAIKSDRPNRRDGVFRWNFFDSIKIITNELDERVAKIVVGDVTFQQLLNKQTIKIYNKELSQLTQEYSQLIVHLLQKERLEQHVKNASMQVHLPYEYFLSHTRMNHSKRKDNMQMIENSLLEFKELQIVVKEYKKTLSGFNIEFRPLTKMEIHDYFERMDRMTEQLTLEFGTSD